MIFVFFLLCFSTSSYSDYPCGYSNAGVIVSINMFCETIRRIWQPRISRTKRNEQLQILSDLRSLDYKASA